MAVKKAHITVKDLTLAYGSYVVQKIVFGSALPL
jgi:hypothetical protein